jgi:dTDP-4-dehydrorhamnose reductase
MKKKVLLIGSAGMAGQVIKIELLKYPNYIEVKDIARNSNISSPTFMLDVTNFSEVEKIIVSGRFDYVINCVGILNKSAEDNPDLAILVNSYFPHFIESITSTLQTKIIHISTDCVFSGLKGGYTIADFKDGVGYYAQSKALGEICNIKDLTIRTSIIGPDKNKSGIGLFSWFISQKEDVFGYTNAFWSGVTTLQLAKTIIDLIVVEKKISGIIHLTNNSKISKYNLLLLIKKIFQLDNVNVLQNDAYCVDKSLIYDQNADIPSVPTYDEMIVELKEWMHLNNYTI